MSKVEAPTQTQSFYDFNTKLSQAKYNISNLRKPNNHSKRTILLKPCQDIQPIKINKKSQQKKDNAYQTDRMENKLDNNFYSTGTKFYSKLSQRLSVQTSIKKRREMKTKSLQSSSQKKPNKRVNSQFSVKELNKLNTIKYQNYSEDYKSKKQQFVRSVNPTLDEKYLKQAINSILIAYCSQEKFDLRMQYAALKKFQIDANSLLSQGMSKQNIHKLYQTLFIHSVSFNKLIQEIVFNNNNLIKIVWKVYSILLQYSASGSFDSMIAQIERDKTRKLQGMLKQIATRQQIIENYDELAKQKNYKIYKELRYLRQQNCRLRDIKSCLQEDLKRLQQAYDHEVGLRLKYESKFNEVHGTCRQLQLKHLRLTQRLLQLQQLQENRQKKQIMIVDENIVYRTETEKAKLFVEQAQQTIKRTQKALEEHQLELRKVIQQLITTKAHRRQLQEIILQKNKLLQQQKLKFENLQSCAGIMKHKQYDIDQQNQKLLKNNKELYMQINQKRNQFNELRLQLKNYDQDKNKLLTDCEFQQRKNALIEARYQQLLNKIIDLQKEIQKKQVQLDSSAKIIQSYKNNQQIAQETMKKLRQIQIEQQQKLKQYETKVKKFNQLLNEKDSTLFETQKKFREKKIQMACYFDTEKEVKFKMNILEQSLQKQKQEAKKKKHAYEQQIQTLTNQLNSSMQSYVVNELLLDKIKEQKKQFIEKWKNQKFQRVALETQMKQSLIVLQIETKNCKQLHKQVVQYKNNAHQLNLQLNKLKSLFQQKQKQFNKRQKQLMYKLQKNEKLIGNRAMYIHPMLLQDALQKLRISQTKQQQNQKIFNKALQNEERQKKKLKNQVQSISKSFNQFKQQRNLEDKSQIYLQQIKLKDQQIIIYKEQLQSVQQYKKKIIQQTQSKYSTELKQKTRQLEQLIQQLEQVQDQNSSLKKDFTETYKLIETKEVQLLKIEENYSKLNKKLVNIEQQRNRLIQQQLMKREQSLPSQQDTLRKTGHRIETKQYSPNSHQFQKNQKSKINTNTSQRTSQSRRKDLTKKFRNAVRYYQ